MGAVYIPSGIYDAWYRKRNGFNSYGSESTTWRSEIRDVGTHTAGGRLSLDASRLLPLPSVVWWTSVFVARGRHVIAPVSRLHGDGSRDRYSRTSGPLDETYDPLHQHESWKIVVTTPSAWTDRSRNVRERWRNFRALKSEARSL